MMSVRLEEVTSKILKIPKNVSCKGSVKLNITILLTKCINIGNVMIFTGTLGPFGRYLHARKFRKIRIGNESETGRGIHCSFHTDETV